MKKTVTVNLAGQVYNIDEDAFDALSRYLNAIKKMYRNEDGGDEIIADIEARISEVFHQHQKTTGKNVISIAEVDRIIAMLGKPEEFESEYNEPEREKTTSSTGAQTTINKRLYRDPEDTVLAGVCSGLAHYFGMKDPVWIRLIFALMVILGAGGGILIYIVLWIIAPEAKTSAQKLEMRGEPINLENIEKTFRDGFQTVGENFQNIGKDDSAFTKLLKGIGSIIVAIVKVVLGFAKAFVIFLFGILIFAMAVGMFGLSVSGFAILPMANTYLFEQAWVGYLAALGAILMTLIVGLFFVLLPFQVFAKNIRPFRRSVSYTMLALFIIGLLLTLGGVADAGRYFTAAQEYKQTSVVEATMVPDTIIIKSNQPYGDAADPINVQLGAIKFQINEDGVISNRVKVNLSVSPDSNLYIGEKYKAKGKNQANATQNVRNIAYNYQMKDNQLILDETIQARTGELKWRDQSVAVNLEIPEGTVLVFDNVSHLIQENIPVKTTWSGYEMPLGSTAWVINNGFLVPLDTMITPSEPEVSVQMKNITPGKKFDKIDLSGFIKAEIIKGRELQVLSDDEERMTVKVSGSTLKLSSKSSTQLGSRAKASKVKIYVPTLEHLEVSGLSSAEMTGFTTGSFSAEVSGNSSLAFNGVHIDGLTLELTGVSTFKGFGSVRVADISASGTSQVNAFDIPMEKLSLDLSGASDANVQVSKSVSGNLSGASKLSYQGQPSLDVQTSGASKVRSAR